MYLGWTQIIGCPSSSPTSPGATTDVSCSSLSSPGSRKTMNCQWPLLLKPCTWNVCVSSTVFSTQHPGPGAAQMVGCPHPQHLNLRQPLITNCPAPIPQLIPGPGKASDHCLLLPLNTQTWDDCPGFATLPPHHSEPWAAVDFWLSIPLVLRT